jgi:2,3,4,5-tetrahydropyridine-2-carboxylate N-succinyltransferase
MVMSSIANNTSVEFEKIIVEAWENRNISPLPNLDQVKATVAATLQLLDMGQLRIANKIESKWTVQDWTKKAILLYFKLNECEIMQGPASHGTTANWYDKVPLKCHDWQKENFIENNFRSVPGAIIRHSAYIGKQVVLMPCFVNVGAYIDNGTLIDTWSTIGSCAQIGKNCHISGGVGIGGVLEPVQANPVIIEDNCFIGARSEIAEGVIVEEGAVISMGVYIGSSTKIIDRDTGEVSYGRVPAYSVVVPGTIGGENGKPSLYAAIIVKKVDAQTRSKIAINELLRT